MIEWFTAKVFLAIAITLALVVGFWLRDEWDDAFQATFASLFIGLAMAAFFWVVAALWTWALT